MGRKKLESLLIELGRKWEKLATSEEEEGQSKLVREKRKAY